jgi:lipoprotein NlpI
MMTAMSTNLPNSGNGAREPLGRVATLACAALIIAPTIQAVQESRALRDEAVAEFAAGRIEASLERFDRLIELDPDEMPYLWHRGIALYYAERWDDCRAQFEAHRVVNPNDVENAAWHFLCVARQESPARARELLLPVGIDFRVPMGEIYGLFQGVTAPDAVIEFADDDLGRFYAHLYVGLWFEARGEIEAAKHHIGEAARGGYAPDGLYMHMVARVHEQLR